jgi:hypothetical protein
MTFEVEYQADDKIRFTTPLMSAKHDGQDITVAQSLNGGWLFLNDGGKRYSLSMEKLVVAWLESVRGDGADAP